MRYKSQKFEAVNKTRHIHWAFGPHTGYAFVRDVTHVEIMANECHRVACDMPILWVKDASAKSTFTMSVVCASPAKDWPVGASGEWLGTYVPLLLRTYPFFPGQLQSQEVGMFVDPASDMVRDLQGAGPDDGWYPLFDASGNVTPALESVAQVLQGAHKARMETYALGRALDQLGLLRPIEVDGEHSADLYRVDIEKMNQLAPAFEQLFRQRSWLKALYAHVVSLGHVNGIA